MATTKLANLSKEELAELLSAKRKEICRIEQELLREIETEFQGREQEEAKEQEKAQEKGEESSKGKSAAKLGAGEKEKKDENAPNKSNTSEENKTAAAEKAQEEESDEYDIWKAPKWCIPIRADVRNFDFKKLAETQRKLTGRLFDVIMTDPPWQLATSNPTRGVAIGYQQLADSLIRAIPFGSLQDNGFLFIWVINVKYKFALDWAEGMGYTLVDEVVWVKSTVNRRLAKSHGFYLQHAKETCLVFRKGQAPPNTQPNVDNDVIYSVRRGQSQKPVEIYEMIERLVPGGTYLEIFGRRNNLRDYWCTIGNEL